MENVPLGSDTDVRQLNELVSLFDAPAYIRRARGVEQALEHLLARACARREEWLPMARLRLGRLRALAGCWEALRPMLANDEQLAVLEGLHAALNPKLRVAVEPTRSRRRLRGALGELVESLERFNARWRAYLDKIDLRHVNQKRADYNRYYVIEKACALRSDVLARLGFTPLAPLELAEVKALLPPLPVPRLAV
jgi:hypothetical protein